MVSEQNSLSDMAEGGLDDVAPAKAVSTLSGSHDAIWVVAGVDRLSEMDASEVAVLTVHWCFGEKFGL